MKKAILIFTLLLCMSNLASSQGWDSTTLNNNNITSSITLNASTKYIMKGFVYVKPPAVLTIPAGTLIYGDKATTGTILIERGAQIIANGTATQPIVFTSRLDTGERGPGDWGGIILLGKAEINTVSGADTAAIEGMPVYVQPAYYGGHDNSDNSGVLRYVRIEFPGINLTGVSGNEINGLTMGGIGSGTTIEYVQVSYSGDDSYEWFGGTVNCKYLISYKGVDDGFDTDNGYRGNLQFLIDVKDSNIADISGTNGFESDNNANSPVNFNTPRTKPIFSNVTLVGPLRTLSTSVNPNHKRGIHIRRNTLLNVYNSIVMGFKTGTRFDGTGVANACNGDTISFKSLIYAGNQTLADTNAMHGNGFYGPTFLQTGSFNNRVFNTNAELNLQNPYGYENNGSWMPLAGSPALTGGNFTYANLMNPFFTQTTFVGAFGSNNWTANWAQFNPTNYVIGIKNISLEVPSEFQLSQNYPNPFNPTTKINFAIPKTGVVTLKVYDVTGKEIANLLNQNLTAGSYEYEFDASDLTSGIYFYTLSGENFRETKKMMLVK
ncbi:MAG: T9SS type A sorting domain-containing protein [Ignavibacteria bacterium]|nr:T9SS type A sorting domain-containing protein [Ignavibacteria bacterium]